MLPVSNSGIRATSSNLRVTSLNLQVTSSNPRVTSSNLGVERLKAQVGILKLGAKTDKPKSQENKDFSKQSFKIIQ